jgi:hypothetical protein
MRLIPSLLALALPREVRQTGKVFVLGPGKTATHTLHAMFRSRGRVACHEFCKGLLWPAESVKHASLDAKVWRSFDAFSDRGENADFAWLNDAMPDARFLLSSRPLLSWLRSRLDHYAHSSRDRRNSTDTEILGWLLKTARDQAKVLEYFNQTASRRARFALVDVEAMAGADVEQIVDWIIRRDSHSLLPAGLVLSAADLPVSRREVAARKLPHAYSYKADAAQSSLRVGRLLQQAGCREEAWSDSLYAACAASVSAHQARTSRAQRPSP